LRRETKSRCISLKRDNCISLPGAAIRRCREAPASWLDDARVCATCDGAGKPVTAAEAIGYASCGQQNRNSSSTKLWRLQKRTGSFSWKMNTRLPGGKHPVTEAITGIDASGKIGKLRVAAGLKGLPLRQDGTVDPRATAFRGAASMAEDVPLKGSCPPRAR